MNFSQRQADPRTLSHLEGGKGHAAVRQVGARAECLSIGTYKASHSKFSRKIDRRGIARFDPESLGQKCGLTQMAARLADHDRKVAHTGASGDHLVQRGKDPHRADGRGRKDARAVGLIVKADVAGHDRHVE